MGKEEGASKWRKRDMFLLKPSWDPNQDEQSKCVSVLHMFGRDQTQVGMVGEMIQIEEKNWAHPVSKIFANPQKYQS